MSKENKELDKIEKLIQQGLSKHLAQNIAQGNGELPQPDGKQGAPTNWGQKKGPQGFVDGSRKTPVGTAAFKPTDKK